MAHRHQPLTSEYVKHVFKGLEEGKGADFLHYVSESVDWTVKGTQPLAGRYTSRQAFQDGPLKRIAAGLKDPIVMKLTGILVSGDWAIVEMFADGAVAKAGWTFDNNYCWLCCFQQGIIVKVRAYLDSAMVARLIEESEG